MNENAAESLLFSFNSRFTNLFAVLLDALSNLFKNQKFVK